MWWPRSCSVLASVAHARTWPSSPPSSQAKRIRAMAARGSLRRATSRGLVIARGARHERTAAGAGEVRHLAVRRGVVVHAELPAARAEPDRLERNVGEARALRRDRRAARGPD